VYKNWGTIQRLLSKIFTLKTPIMKLNDFEVVIPEGDETEEGYVCLKHGTQYSIKLRNHSERLRCNATVKIDGRSVGTWRVDQGEAITIERPVHDSGRFTFYQEGTPEAAKANIRPTDELGLISVLFRPEKRKDDPFIPRLSMAGPRPYAAGGTGLSGKSAQQFDEAEEIEIDDERAVTIHLRLVAIQNEPRPLFPLETPVPPAVQTKTEAFIKSDGCSASEPIHSRNRFSRTLMSLGLYMPCAYIAYLLFSIWAARDHTTVDAEEISKAADHSPAPQSAFVAFGEGLQQEKSTSSSPAEDHESLLKAANKGDSKALYLLGSQIGPEIICGFDSVLSFSLMKIAINKGYDGSITRCAEVASNMSQADHALAMELAEKAMQVEGQQWSVNWLKNERKKQLQQSSNAGTSRLTAESVSNVEHVASCRCSLCIPPSPSRWTPVLQDWVTSEGKVIRALFVDLQDSGVVLEVPGTGDKIYRPFSRLSPQSQEQAKADQLAKTGVAAVNNTPHAKVPTTTSAFGGAITLPPPPKSEHMTHLPTDQRLSSGALLVDRLAGRNRYGKLEVVNGLSEDALVKLISNERLAVSFYVRGGETFKLTSIPDGSYSLLYCTGFGWSQQKRDFSRGRHASRHDKTLQFTTDERVEGRKIITSTSVISLTLHKVISGNTTTSEVSLEEFDKYN
jgi:hypothetical protein